MKRRCLLIGLLLTAVIACRPSTEEDSDVPGTEPVPLTTPAIAQPLTATPTPDELTAIPAPKETATPQPTAAPPEPLSNDNEWRTIGSEATGLQFTMPAGWSNLSGQLDVPAAANQLGLTTLFLADNERTGTSLLAGKEIGMGAFVLAVIADRSPGNVSPTNDLAELLTQMGVSPLATISTAVAQSSSGTTIGAVAEFTGEPMGFPLVAGQSFQMRLYLFPIYDGNGALLPDTQALILQGATADDWPQFSGDFNRMGETIVVYDVQSGLTINDGTVNIVGELATQALFRATLQAGITDVWTFAATDGRYATLTLSSDNGDLDLRLTIIDANGQTVMTIDNGYTGDMEIAADILLVDDARYFVQVDEFFEKSGRYTLSLSLTDEPLLSTGGRLRIGQTVESELLGSQHIWSFEGTAEQIVSIVLQPEDEKFDAILNVYGPDGKRLVALDEGFSGDAEIATGLELPITGEYIIVVLGFADEGGAYSLSLDEGGETTLNFYDAGDILYGEMKQETLQAFEAHAWFFEGKAGDEVMVKVSPLNGRLDLDIWLLNSRTERLTTSDAFLAGSPETIMWQLPADEQYIVVVRDFFGEAGDYVIEVNGRTIPPASFAGTLTYGEPITPTLAPETSVFWQFDGEEGDTVDIFLTPLNDVDFLFTLEDPTGKQVLRVDAASLGNPESYRGFVLTADGFWRIVVTTFFNDGGVYILQVEQE
jgi:hypothetical protein